MGAYTVPNHIAEQMRDAANEGRLMQGHFQFNDHEGRLLVCALGAMGARSVEFCPAAYMPRWLARLIPTLFDGIDKDDTTWFVLTLAERAQGWRVMDADAWDRIHRRLLDDFEYHTLEPGVGEMVLPRLIYGKADPAALVSCCEPGMVLSISQAPRTSAVFHEVTIKLFDLLADEIAAAKANALMDALAPVADLPAPATACDTERSATVLTDA